MAGADFLVAPFFFFELFAADPAAQHTVVIRAFLLTCRRRGGVFPPVVPDRRYERRLLPRLFQVWVRKAIAGQELSRDSLILLSCPSGQAEINGRFSQ